MKRTKHFELVEHLISRPLADSFPSRGSLTKRAAVEKPSPRGEGGAKRQMRCSTALLLSVALLLSCLLTACAKQEPSAQIAGLQTTAAQAVTLTGDEELEFDDAEEEEFVEF